MFLVQAGHDLGYFQEIWQDTQLASVTIRMEANKSSQLALGLVDFMPIN